MPLPGQSPQQPRGKPPLKPLSTNKPLPSHKAPKDLPELKTRTMTSIQDKIKPKSFNQMSETLKSKRSDSISELDLASVHNSEHRGPPPKVMGDKNQTSSNMFPEISARR